MNFNRYSLEENGVYFKTANDLRIIIDEFNTKEFSEDIQKIFKTYKDRYTRGRIAEQYAKLFFKSC